MGMLVPIQSKMIPFRIYLLLLIPVCTGHAKDPVEVVLWGLTFLFGHLLPAYARALNVRLVTNCLHLQSSIKGVDHSEENSWLFKSVLDVRKPHQVNGSLLMSQMNLEFFMIMIGA